MAVSQTDLDAVETAIIRGERIVHYGDRRVEYRDTTQMVAAAAYIRTQLASAATASRTTLASFSRD